MRARPWPGEGAMFGSYITPEHEHLLAEDAVLPVQLLDDSHEFEQEEGVLWEVLLLGVNDTLGRNLTNVNNGHRDRLRNFNRSRPLVQVEAEDWIFGRQVDDLMSFEGLCREFNINPARVRAAIRTVQNPFCPCHACEGRNL